MDVCLIEVGGIRLDVGLSCESGESLFEEIHTKGVSARQKNVYSQIKFEIVDEVGPIYISLDNIMRAVL